MFVIVRFPWANYNEMGKAIHSPASQLDFYPFDELQRDCLKLRPHRKRCGDRIK